LLKSKVPKKKTTPPMENLDSIMRNVVLGVDNLKTGRTVPRRRNRFKKVEVTDPESDERPI
jgi:hypothetical protein